MNADPERLTLYGSFTSSSSYKPILYLALARLPFSFRTVNLKTGVQKTPEYLAVNRWGVVPSLRHRGLTILQSNVILDYLARTTGHFEPAGEQHRWQAREWLSWEADHITNIARVRHFSRFRTVDPAVMAHFRPLAEAALSFVDRHLADRDGWSAIAARSPISAAGAAWCSWREGSIDIAEWPNVEAWSGRLKAMPGFALPYDLIPKKDQEIDTRLTAASADGEVGGSHDLGIEQLDRLGSTVEAQPIGHLPPRLQTEHREPGQRTVDRSENSIRRRQRAAVRKQPEPGPGSAPPPAAVGRAGGRR